MNKKKPCGLDYCPLEEIVGAYASCTACAWGNDGDDKTKEAVGMYDGICYWYEEDHDMGATFPYCSKYDSYAEGKYGERPRNCHDENCESYISKTDVKNLVINYQKNKRSNTLSKIKRVPTIATIEEYGLGGVRVKTVVENEF